MPVKSRYQKQPYHRLYNTRRWKDLRKGHLVRHPLCQYCAEQDRAVPATVVDHVVPHRGDEALFFEPANLQSLCKPHHDATKQAEERAGLDIGCDIDGMPLDPAHHWHK